MRRARFLTVIFSTLIITGMSGQIMPPEGFFQSEVSGKPFVNIFILLLALLMIYGIKKLQSKVD